MRQPGVAHDVGDAGAVIAAAPDRACGGFDDPLVRGFFGAGCDSAHMTCIIFCVGNDGKSGRAVGSGKAARIARGLADQPVVSSR
ncbi:MAG TPA: hypothetical protein VJ724_05560, partial [Tahibacter sp.]|nr:hypothetical protein [Tahibacter sp.]